MTATSFCHRCRKPAGQAGQGSADWVFCRRCTKATEVYKPPAPAIAYPIQPVPWPDLRPAIIAADASEWSRVTGWGPYDSLAMAMVMNSGR